MGSEYSITSCFFLPNQKVLFLGRKQIVEVEFCIGFGPLLTPNLLLQFLNQDGNILLVLSADSTIPSAISSLLVELDIHLPPDRKTLVVDHLNYDTISAPEKHDVLLLPHPPPIRSDLKTFFGGQGTIAFPKGVPQQLGTETPHLSSILRAKNTAYSYNPQDESESVEDPYTVGGQVSLVSAFQARNSARLTVFGSSQALENQWFNAKIKGLDGKQSITSNKLFAKQVTAWTFKETGVLHVGRMEHRLSSIDDESLKNNTVALLEGQNPKIYRIKNDVVCSAPSSIKICLIKSPKTFNVELSEYSYDHLSPFTILPADALQLEFTMLSAFYRLDLKPIFQTTNSNVFGTSFKLPDQHGIFTFRINYKRPFLTNIDVKEEVTLRHFAHDEWPRSWEISAGWVWIAGLWVTVIGWIAFVALWLWSEPSLERS